MSNDALTERLERTKKLQRGWYITQLSHNAPQLIPMLVGQTINISGVHVRAFPNPHSVINYAHLVELPDGLGLLHSAR